MTGFRLNVDITMSKTNEMFIHTLNSDLFRFFKQEVCSEM